MVNAVANAEAQSKNGPSVGVGMCKKAVIAMYDVPTNGTPSAAAAWANAKHKHPTTDPSTIPPNVPVFWTGGSQGFGHVAISGFHEGIIWSTDILRPGFFDRVPIGLIAERWGLTLVGWSEDIDGVQVYDVKPSPNPTPTPTPAPKPSPAPAGPTHVQNGNKALSEALREYDAAVANGRVGFARIKRAAIRAARALPPKK